MPLDLIYMLMFIVVGIGFCLVVFGVQSLLAPSRPSKRKQEPYECGEYVQGQPWVKFHIRYYIFALLFLIFDVETAFLFPWAVVYRKLGLFGLIEMFIFITILLVALAWPWRKGVLKWV